MDQHHPAYSWRGNDAGDAVDPFVEDSSGARQRIAYRMPAFYLDGRPLVGFDGFAAHCSLFAMSGTVRARLAEGDGQPDITPFDRQDSALLSILGEADALLIRPVEAGPRGTGTTVEYLPL